MKYQLVKYLAIITSLLPTLVPAALLDEQIGVHVNINPIYQLGNELEVNIDVQLPTDANEQMADLWVVLDPKANDNLIYMVQNDEPVVCHEDDTGCAVPYAKSTTMTNQILDIPEFSIDSLPLSSSGIYAVYAFYTQADSTLAANKFLSPIGSASTRILEQPNFVIFLADDLGYSDISPFGSEADTPALDILADEGILLTNFHTQAACSPTRAMMLSGVDNHRNGLGTMDGRLIPEYLSYATNQYSHQEAVDADLLEKDNALNADGQINNPHSSPTKNIGKPGYEGQLNKRVVTLATVLKEAGYHTYITGKWHLGENEEYRPYSRGFEHTFVLLEGASSNFNHIGFTPEYPYTHYTKQGQIVELPMVEEVATTRAKADELVGYGDKYQLFDEFYSTRDYTDFMINNIEANRADGKPFLAYFAYQAPHGPLQSPVDLTEKYMPIYEAGWDEIRRQRFDRMIEKGLISENLPYPDRWSNNAGEYPAWDSLTLNQKKVYAKKMAIYSGMIEYMDFSMQRFMDYLKNVGEYDNTVILFFGDNGADDQNRDVRANYLAWYPEVDIFNCLPEDVTSADDITQNPCYQNMGLAKSFITLPPEWVQVSSTPFYAAKATVAEGGLRAPSIITIPNAAQGIRADGFMSILDIFPTFLDYALVSHPAEGATCGTLIPYQDREEGIYPLDGRSFRPLFDGKTDNIYGETDAIGFELYGSINRALYMGDWKILKLGDNPWGAGEDTQWALYNLKSDPRELINLSGEYPEVYNTMIQKYSEYVDDVGYIPNLTTQQNQRSRTSACFTETGGNIFVTETCSTL
ncbi:arylsulfatase [Candidatus Albibeggiatoa sp. nov. BB20]|uniref:arylsulfatase n=1 Tax=Candidatus Albibeggiatoa sp. nov. BB20 TaxID=3162723 RepID=UPI0033653421